MMQTLDQKRATLAWLFATEGVGRHGTEYRNLAKGAPALIMTSGLMPTLAYYKSKGNAARQLLDDLIRGIEHRLACRELKAGQGISEFGSLMVRLQRGDSATYLRHTDEALELLKWIRQFVDAVEAQGA